MDYMNFLTSSLKYTVNMEELKAALMLMWQGMLGIFVVMAVIALLVFAFTKFSK